MDEVRAGGDDSEDESDEDGHDGEEDGEGEGVPGWDSELTELTESEGDGDEGESEVDVPLKVRVSTQLTPLRLLTSNSALIFTIALSQDATTAQTTTATASTSTSTTTTSQPLRIKLPAHTTVYRKRKPAHVCQKSTCQNLLTRSARWKMCLGCRIRVREYERARRGGYAKWLKSDGEDDEVAEVGEKSEVCGFVIGCRGRCAYGVFLLWEKMLVLFGTYSLSSTSSQHSLIHQQAAAANAPSVPAQRSYPRSRPTAGNSAKAAVNAHDDALVN